MFFDLQGETDFIVVVGSGDTQEYRVDRRGTRSKRAPGGCLRLLVAMKDVASDETLRGPAGRG